MKNLMIAGALMAFTTVMAGCNRGMGAGDCHIKGIAPASCNGKTVYLVPAEWTYPQRILDSCVIEKGAFEFKTDTPAVMKIVFADPSVFEIEPAAVVGESGNVNVRLGATSFVSGTPQNDSLATWKIKAGGYARQINRLQQDISRLAIKGDTATVRKMMDTSDKLGLRLIVEARKLAINLKEGVLHDYLLKKFPSPMATE